MANSSLSFPTGPMPPATLKALQDSIAHWEENLRLTENGQINKIEIFGKACPLCIECDEQLSKATEEYAAENSLTYGIWEEPKCHFCPVAKKAGKANCKNTPWTRVRDHFKFMHTGFKPHEAAIAAVHAELDFLKSLLPTNTNQQEPAP